MELGKVYTFFFLLSVDIQLNGMHRYVAVDLVKGIRPILFAIFLLPG